MTSTTYYRLGFDAGRFTGRNGFHFKFSYHGETYTGLPRRAYDAGYIAGVAAGKAQREAK